MGLNIARSKKNEFARGMVMGYRGELATDVTAFTAMIIVTGEGKIKPGYCAYVCCHSMFITCRVVEFLQKVDKRTGKIIEEAP